MFQRESPPPAAAAEATRCAWTYHMECNESRSPLVSDGARCLNASDYYAPVLATVVKRRNSAIEQLDEVEDHFACACRRIDPANFYDYSDNLFIS